MGANIQPDDSPRWGRATTIAAPGAPATGSLKRTANNDDSDAVLANCFEEDEPLIAPTTSIQYTEPARPIRALPSRGMRPTVSMPPLHDISPAFNAAQNCPDAEMSEDAFQTVDFSAFTSRTDGF